MEEEEEVEVVEEEAVLDDLHLHYANNFYAEVEYEAFEVDDEEASVDPVSVLDTTITKIKEAYLDKSKRKFRVPATEVTSELYDAFCEKVVNHNYALPGSINQKLDSLYHSGDWAIARNFPDAYLGVLPTAMVHLPSNKFLLKPDDRTRLLTATVSKHQNTRNPVGEALQEIQKLYLGMPAIGQLRNLLLVELRKIFPLVQSPVVVAEPATNGKGMSSRGGYRKGASAKRKRLLEARMVVVGGEGEQTQPMIIDPIDDGIYDDLAEVIASGQKSTDYDWPMPIKSLLAKGGLIAQMANDPNTSDLDEIFTAGWCIRERVTGRLVPRKNDVARIWRRVHDRMIRTNSLAQIIAYVEAKFVGITSAEQRRSARVEDVYKGARVLFPTRPAITGRRPMQYVQVDLIDAPFAAFHSEEAEHALVIVDLHSQYALCKPVVDIAASVNDLLRFAYESFAAFGPPESYVTSTETKSGFYIHQMMEELQRHFKISIKCTGFVRDHDSSKAISAEAMRRVETERDLRWSEMVHEASVEWNQRLCRVFSHQFSPFEAMFGRRAWNGGAVLGGGCSSRRLPPWISREGGEKEGAGEGGEEHPLPPAPPLKETIQAVIGSLVAPEARMDAAGTKVLDPGTGIRYEIGDRVYVRNVRYEEPSTESPTKRAPKGHTNRYLRGVVVEEDNRHPEFLYRIVYETANVDHDALPIDEWPTIHDDNNVDMDASWFSPWDVSPSSYDLQCRRVVAESHEVAATSCSCELEFCDLAADVDCARARNVICCARHPEGACAAHRTIRTKYQRKRKVEEEAVVREAGGGGGVEDSDARYVFKNGALIRFNAPSSNRAMELPEEILQE